MASRIAALVPRGTEAGEFDPAWFSSSECRVMSLAMKFGMMAADEAVEDVVWGGVESGSVAGGFEGRHAVTWWPGKVSTVLPDGEI